MLGSICEHKGLALMALATAAHNYAKGILSALGLEGKPIREMDIRMAVGELVTVRTVEFAEEPSMEGFERELVARRYKAIRWVPVEEMLPRMDEEVLVWDSFHKRTRVGRRLTDGTNPYFHVSGGWNNPTQVTHWAPLLEPPTDAV